MINKLFSINEKMLNKFLNNYSVCPCPISTIKSSDCFELVHIVVWEPYSTPTFDENRYFFYSRMISVE